MTARLLVLLLAAFLALPASAKKEGRVATVSGTFMIEIPSYMSLDQAKHEALVKAQNQAIENEFGSTNTNYTISWIDNNSNSSDVSVHSFNQGVVRGVWLGDEAEPIFKQIIQDGKNWLEVKVKGKVRELITAGIEFEAQPLCIEPRKDRATTEFKNGQDLFLYFRSPADGYLTVFLFDNTSNEVFTMLPYQSSSLGHYRINHDEDYFLFAPSKAKPDDGTVDELVITSTEGKTEEFNYIYVIFSPNAFYKVNSTKDQQKISDELVLPSSLPYKDFNKWLIKYQQKDEDMQVMRIPIHITNQ